MPRGKYYYIVSRLNGLVLDVSGGEAHPGAKVVTWSKKSEDEADNQLWLDCPITNTIRTKCNKDYCLDISDGTLVINPYSEGDPNQKWDRDDDMIRRREDRGKVLDIKSENTDEGAELCCWDEHGNDNQKFEFEHIKEWNNTSPAPYFWIESQLNGKVLDIADDEEEAGGKVIMYSKKDDPTDNQLWYEDSRDIIRSKLNNLVLDSSDGCIQMQQYIEKDEQMWVIREDKIVNSRMHGQVLDIRGADEDDGAEICAYDWHGNQNQRWNIVYV